MYAALVPLLIGSYKYLMDISLGAVQLNALQRLSQLLDCKLLLQQSRSGFLIAIDVDSHKIAPYVM